MASTIQELLYTPRINRVASYYKVPTQRFQEFMGCTPGGPNTTQTGVRHYVWDIYNNTRDIAHGRAPGTSPGNRPNQVIGQGSSTLARFHEQTYIPDEKVFQTRPIGSSWGTVDARGEAYIVRQIGTLTQRFRNAREFMISRMSRGFLYFKQVGDDWIPIDQNADGTDPAAMVIKVDFKMPASNRLVGAAFAAGLNMKYINGDGTEGSSITGGNIIDASWATASTDIPLHLGQINACYEAQHGWPLEHIWCTFKVWNNVLQNDKVKALAGTANSPFAQYDRMPGTSADGVGDTGFVGIVKGIPWLQWHVYDAVLNVDSTPTKVIPNGYIIAMPTPNFGWFEYAEGAEPVAEHDQDQGHIANGFELYKTRRIKPPGWELVGVDNGLPIPIVPATMVYARVQND